MGEDIIEKLKGQDSRAQEAFYKAYAQRMFVLCYRYLNSEDDCADVVNVGFHKVFCLTDQFREGGLKEFLAWTKTIMINECLQVLRRRKKINFVSIDAVDGIGGGDLSMEPNIDVDAQVLLDILSRLPDNSRTVFNLFVIEGYAHSEIAAMLQIPESTSRSHLLRARKELQMKIKAMYRD